MKLKEVTQLLDTTLDIYRIPDASKNGLQIGDTANNPEVKRIAFAVDITNEIIEQAIEKKADMLVVHHGFFWKEGISSIKEFNYKKIQYFFENKLALYAAHLPLDKHETLGNNYTLARKLDLHNVLPFGYDRDIPIGCYGELSSEQSLETVQELVTEQTNAPTTPLTFGPEEIKTVAIISGKANTALLEQVYYKKIDLFITGERSYPLHNAAQDLGVNVLFLGHYHSETFGIRALQDEIEKKTGIETVFIDRPTLF
jgi:dinuclear metal center YbgI/SA1388 family protein